jgi:hypothetical protein
MTLAKLRFVVHIQQFPSRTRALRTPHRTAPYTEEEENKTRAYYLFFVYCFGLYLLVYMCNLHDIQR